MEYSRMFTNLVGTADFEFLDDPRASPEQEYSDPRPFQQFRPLSVTSPFFVRVDRPGRRMPICMTAHSNWIVTPMLGELISRFAGPVELQRVPCITEDGRHLEILNALAPADCVDFEKSEGIEWFPDSKGRDKQIRFVRKLVIDKSKAGERHLFRIAAYKLPLIVSAPLRAELERLEPSGLMFMPVTE